MGKDKGKDVFKKVSNIGGRARGNGNPRNRQFVEENGNLWNRQFVEGDAGQLLPGIFNEIVLDHIVPKLPWRAFHTLSSVSPCWRLAIQSRQIYNARVRSNSVEKLVAFDHQQYDNLDIHAMSIFSVRDESWHQLPKFPFYKKGLPKECSCVASDGNFYVFAHCSTHNGMDSDDDVEDSPSWSGDSDGLPLVPKTGRELFVFDLVGQTGWKRCADMPKPRCKFACCVLHGKVYVLGGILTGSIRLGDHGETKPPTRGCLMYDPKEDSWSSIAPMITKRHGHKVTVMEDRLWVEFGGNQQGRRLGSELYDPVKNKWTRVKPERHHGYEYMFTAKGKAFLMTSEDLAEELYSPEEPLKNRFSNWTQTHPVGINGDVWKGLSVGDSIAVVGAEAVDNELLVLLETYDAMLNWRQTVLCRNRMFGRLPQNRNVGRSIFSQEGTLPTNMIEPFGLDLEPTRFSQHGWWARFMCPIEL